MMTHAYDEAYLPGAMERLGAMIEYATDGIGMDTAVFYRLFLASGVADSFGSGHPRYIAGLSGKELARMVITTVSDLEFSSEPYAPSQPQDTFWAGWALAYFQWYTGLSFRFIDSHGLDIGTVLSLYHPLHEADISKFVDIGLTRIRQWQATHKPSLKAIRKAAGLTQVELAERSGVSLRMIRAYEQGSQDISKAEAGNVLSLARHLNVDVPQLLNRD